VDGIAPKLLKRALPYSLSVVTHIFNFYLSAGVYLGLWSTAVIYSICMIKNLSALSDYRPISLLCAISKVLEHIVAARSGASLRILIYLIPVNQPIAGDRLLRLHSLECLM